MRVNKYVAAATGLSRRAADSAVADGRVTINGQPAEAGQDALETDLVTLDGRPIMPTTTTTTIMLHKPVGYICSRNGQGGQTVYDLLPPQYQRLQPVGRLDKMSSGLLLLSDNGHLIQELTHPSHQKNKVYEITLDRPLEALHHQMISDHGIVLEDGLSRFALSRVRDGDDQHWQIVMQEGRNRQIRRTLAALGYTVTRLHRTSYGPYHLGQLPSGAIRPV